MARYKHYDYGQTKLLPISYERQILPGTFEHTLNFLIDHKIDLSVFDDRYQNDETGAPAYDPAILLKIILFAYSKGITSSREIAALCREHVVFMALSADTTPHFTTIANFVSSLGSEVSRIFRDVLLVCDEAGLIGREMFAVDGVKLPSNASKEWSGTKADLKRKVEKMQRAVNHLMSLHEASDQSVEDESIRVGRAKQKETLTKAIEKVEAFLATNKEKLGRSGKPKQSNITDNESAKMRTSKGVVQGYNGLAMVDAKAQVIVHAEAHGEGAEIGLLQPMIEGTRATFNELQIEDDVFAAAKLTADAGYSSEANATYLFENGIDAYVADTLYRKRDPRFKNAERHKPTRPDEPFAKLKKEKTQFANTDFQLAEDQSHCICPAGQRINRNSERTIGAYDLVTFRGTLATCSHCKTSAANCVSASGIYYWSHEEQAREISGEDEAQDRLQCCRHHYSRRLETVEPVFANIRYTHRLNRFSLRGRTKVNGQWLLFCLVHNIGKVQHHGSRVMTRMKRGRRRAA